MQTQCNSLLMQAGPVSARFFLVSLFSIALVAVLYTRKNRFLAKQSKVNCKYPGCLCLYPETEAVALSAERRFPVCHCPILSQIVLFCLFHVAQLSYLSFCCVTLPGNLPELFVTLNTTRTQLHMFTHTPRPLNQLRMPFRLIHFVLPSNYALPTL